MNSATKLKKIENIRAKLLDDEIERLERLLPVYEKMLQLINDKLALLKQRRDYGLGDM